jgi:hypothetical protein
MLITLEMVKNAGGKKAIKTLGAYKVLKGELAEDLAEELELEEGISGQVFVATKEVTSKSGNSTFKKGDYFFIAND